MLRIRKNGGISECSVINEELVGKRRCDHLKGSENIVKDYEDYVFKYESNFNFFQKASLERVKELINSSDLRKECSQALKNVLKSENSTYVVAATGFGKSIIIQETCLNETSKGKWVLIVGQKGQQDSFMRNGMSPVTHVDFVGYEEFAKSNIDLSKYSTIIFDECQKAVSANTAAIISNQCQAYIKAAKVLGIKVIGFTASPVRTDGENVKNIFEKCAYECNIYDAIEGECYSNLPNYYVPEFTSWHYEKINKLLKIRETLSGNNQKEFDQELIKLIPYSQKYKTIEDVKQEECKFIDSLVAQTIKELGDKQIKIVFHCKTKKQADEYRETYRNILSKYGTCSFGNFLSGDDESDETKEFFGENPKSKINAIFTVDKYSTGYHDDDLAIQVIAYQKQSIVGKIQTNGRSYGSRNFSCKVVDLWNCHNTNLGISWDKLKSSSEKLKNNTMKFSIKSKQIDDTIKNLMNIVKKDKNNCIVDGSELYTSQEVAELLFDNYRVFELEKRTKIKRAIDLLIKDGQGVEDMENNICSIENHNTWISMGRTLDVEDLPINNKEIYLK